MSYNGERLKRVSISKATSRIVKATIYCVEIRDRGKVGQLQFLPLELGRVKIIFQCLSGNRPTSNFTLWRGAVCFSSVIFG